MKRTHLNLALAAVVAGLGIAIWYAEKKEPAGPPLTALKAEQLTRVAVEHPGAEAIVLEKKDGAWRLTAPVQGLADGIEVNALLGVAGLETKETLDVSQARLSDLQLDPPQYSVTLNDTRVDFGGVEPLNYRRYAKVGAAVYLIEDPPTAALDKEFADLVAKAVVPEGETLTKIELPGLTLAQDAEGRWQATPATGKATPEAIQKVVDGWKNARAMWNDADAPPPAKSETVVLTLKDRTLKLVIAEKDPQFKLYAPDLRVRYVLSKALTAELLQLPEPPKAEPKEAGAANAQGENKKPGEPDTDNNN